MPWDALRGIADQLHFGEGSLDGTMKQAALVRLHATPEAVYEVIALLSSSNLHLVAHVCGEPDERGKMSGCQETELPESLKMLLILGLMTLRNKELDKKEKAA